jgi:hypothetical protein
MSYAAIISNVSYDHEFVNADVRCRDLYVDRDVFIPSLPPGPTGPAGPPGPTGPTGPPGSGGITTLNQVGGGGQVAQSITGTTLNLRTLRGLGAITLNQTLNTIDFTSPVLTLTSSPGGATLINTTFPNATLKSLIAGVGIDQNNTTNNITFSTFSSRNNTIYYNYGQETNINLSLSYTAPGVVSTNALPTLPEGGGEIFQTSLTTAIYTPGPRENQPAEIFFTTTTSSGLTNNSIIKLYPNISIAYDTLRDFVLGCDTVSGRIWQINMDTFSEKLMEGYDGNPLTITDAQYIAMDIADNLLFFHIETDPFIRVYDFSTGNTENLIEITAIPGYSGIVRGMCFNNSSNTLYFIDDASTIYSISIQPYNRNLDNQIPFGTVLYYPFAISGRSPVNMTYEDNSNSLLIVYSVSGVTQISQVSVPNAGTPSVIEFNTLEASSSIYSLVFAPSGRLYVNSLVTGRMYRFNYGQSIRNSPPIHFSPTVNKYYCMTRCPYGIQA